MAEFLEGAQLVDRDAVADVEIGPRGIEALLNEEWTTLPHRAFELGEEFRFGDDPLGTPPDPVQLFFYGEKHSGTGSVYSL